MPNLLKMLSYRACLKKQSITFNKVVLFRHYFVYLKNFIKIIEENLRGGIGASAGRLRLKKTLCYQSPRTGLAFMLVTCLQTMIADFSMP